MEKENIVSKVFLWINIVYLLGLTLFVIFVGGPFARMYEGAEMALPIITRMAMSSHYIFIILALILIIKEKLIKKKAVTLKINVATCIILVLGGIFLAIGLFLPLIRMGEALESAGINGIGIWIG